MALWSSWTTFQRVTVTLAFLGLVVAVIFGALQACDGSPSADSASPAGQGPRIEDAENVVEEIETRPFWVRQPETYEFSEESIEFLSETEVEWFGDDVVVVTPRVLALGAADYEGRSIILVGQVVEAVAVESKFGIADEVRLADQRGANAYIGTSGAAGTYLEGEIVYALGMVVASGESQTLDGRRFRTAYFLNTDGFVNIVSSSPGSAALRDAAREVDR
jgi:hypothetical protein